jgi:hypothetical protein
MLYIHEALFNILVQKHDLKTKRLFSSEEDKNQCCDLLCQLEDATLCSGFGKIGKLSEFLCWLSDMWEVSDIPTFAAFFPLTKLEYRIIRKNLYPEELFRQWD